MSHFRKMIKANRAKLDLSLQDVANAAEMTKGHLHDLEIGRSANPTIKTIFGLACALRINPDRLAHAALVDMSR